MLRIICIITIVWGKGDSEKTERSRVDDEK